MKKTLSFLALFLIFVFSSVFADDAQKSEVTPNNPAPQREIIKVADNLYRVHDGLYYSVFLVTSKGIILADPISADTAKWLKAQIKERFNLPVKYVIYSHNHYDHVSGGEVFADTATFVAQEKAKEGIIRFNVPTAIPQITFNKKETITLGDGTVELEYDGVTEGMGNITFYFPKQKALYLVDRVVFKRLPYLDMSEISIDNYIDSLKKLLNKDYNIVLPSHGVVGTKSDMVDFINYMETLRSEVIKNINAGKTMEETRPLVEAKMQQYKNLGMYNDWIDMNIDGMYYQMCALAARCRAHPI